MTKQLRSQLAEALLAIVTTMDPSHPFIHQADLLNSMADDQQINPVDCTEDELWDLFKVGAVSLYSESTYVYVCIFCKGLVPESFSHKENQTFQLPILALF
jgi:hypothetical protein